MLKLSLCQKPQVRHPAAPYPGGGRCWRSLQCDAVELSGAVVEACATEMMLKSFERERECLEPAVTSKAKLPYSEGATPATAGLSALKMFEGFALLQSLLGILCQLKCTMEVGRKVLRLGLRRRPEREIGRAHV